MKTTAERFARLVVLGHFLILATQLHAKPLKVFILAGQSNMQGHAKVETFDYIGDDPATAPMLKEMLGADGKPRVLENVWISSIGCLGDAYSDLTEKTGRLTAGFGAPENKIGPEFTFGITMEKLLGEPVLLIKTAWGGRSLHTDFRPPSAGPYVPTPEEAKWWAEKPERKTEIEAATGVFYREMVAHVKKVLADPKRVCPAYDAKQGYEIAGFVWLQGFNDLVSSDTYPPKPGEKVRDYSKYGVWLADLIRDVRKDLAAPKLPVVIGVLGVDGLKANDHTKAFRTAMAAPAALPEFKGNVVAIETAPFWSEELAAIAEKKEKVSQMAHLLKSKNKKEANADGTMTEQQQRDYVKAYEAKIITPAEAAAWKRGASNGGYHYLGCAKTFALMGKAFAEANRALAGKGHAARELTGCAVVTAREAVAEFGKPAQVAGSVAPLEDCYRPDLVPPDDECRAEHSERIHHLVDAGVDLLLIEKSTPAAAKRPSPRQSFCP